MKVMQNTTAATTMELRNGKRNADSHSSGSSVTVSELKVTPNTPHSAAHHQTGACAGNNGVQLQVEHWCGAISLPDLVQQQLLGARGSCCLQWEQRWALTSANDVPLPVNISSLCGWAVVFVDVTGNPAISAKSLSHVRPGACMTQFLENCQG